MSRFKTVAFVACAAVVLAATLAVALRRGGPAEPPAPAARPEGPVRVVASGRDPGHRPRLRPADGVSPAVDTVCGFVPETAARFPVRIAALRSISNRRNLPPEDVLALMDYVASTNQVLAASRVAALKNDVLNLLRRQEPVPEGLTSLLVDMLESGLYDATITDYCIQHLGSMWRDFATEGERENARKAFVSVASRKDVPYAGTALYALADEDGAPEEYRRKLRRLAVDLACDPEANRLARITAIQVAGSHGYAEVLPSARNALSEPHPDAVLAMVSVGTIGCLGAPSDVKLLERFRATAGVRLQPAIDAAIGKLRR